MDAIIINTTIKQEDTVWVSPMGTPLTDVLHIQQGKYYVDANTIVSYDGMTLYAISMSLLQPKNIVNTKILGVDGHVKQYISHDDWAITIIGSLIGQDGVYPTQAVQELLAINEAKVAVQVYSRQLGLAGISHIVIDELELIPRVGYTNVQDFKIQARSDTPYVLTITE